MEREWKPQKIKELFDSVIPGKGKGANHLAKAAIGKIPYIGATNRNNGVMFFVEANDNNKTMMQAGNCIGFIKNGDGSAGYAIYREQAFISTNDVIFGYRANNLDKNTGIFLVAAQDMIQKKYSHGYKRNRERLLKDRIMLPITNDKKPDWNYMASFVKAFRLDLLNRYRKYIEKQLSKLEYKDIPALDEMKWNPVSISLIFDFVRGHENNMAMLDNGRTPLISAKNTNNGLKGFVATPKELIPGHCITLNNDGDGGAGLAYYQPADMALDTHVTALVPIEAISKYTMLFIAECMSGLHDFFGHGLSISNKRAKKIKIMLPISTDGKPDYTYMEQYAKNMMLRKYRQYLSYLEKRERKKE